MVSIEAEDPASFIRAVVLAVAGDRAPPLGLIDANSSLDSDILLREFFCSFLGEDEVLLVGEDEIAVGVEFGYFEGLAGGLEVGILKLGFERTPLSDDV